jgi:uncharacterized membrane protein
MLDKDSELKAWRLATIVMIIMGAAVFFIQRLAGPFLDLVFEFCIFHIPAFVIVALFLYFRRKFR